MVIVELSSEFLYTTLLSKNLKLLQSPAHDKIPAAGWLLVAVQGECLLTEGLEGCYWWTV
jgi:hypothetical protein